MKCPLCDGLGEYEASVDIMIIRECPVCEGSGVLEIAVSNNDTDDVLFSTYPHRKAYAVAQWAFDVMHGGTTAEKYVIENMHKLSCYVSPRTADICDIALDILENHEVADMFTLPQWVFLLEQGVKEQCQKN